MKVTFFFQYSFRSLLIISSFFLKIAVKNTSGITNVNMTNIATLVFLWDNILKLKENIMKERSFTIATFNANGIRARLHIILPWLDDYNVDCLCIQETKVQDKDFPVEVFEERGLNVVFRGQKSYNGVAVITPHPVETVFFGFPDNDRNREEEARQICVQIADLTIVNSYVPQGRSIDNPAFQRKLQWFSRILNLLDEKFGPSSPLIWCGDMNVAPEPIDVYAPELKENHVCFHRSVREAFKKILKWGMSDCFRLIHPGEPEQYSFFDYRIPRAVERKLGWRIDHILATAPVASNIKDSFIDLEPRKKNKPSDHTFVVAHFQL